MKALGSNIQKCKTWILCHRVQWLFGTFVISYSIVLVLWVQAVTSMPILSCITELMTNLWALGSNIFWHYYYYTTTTSSKTKEGTTIKLYQEFHCSFTLNHNYIQIHINIHILSYLACFQLTSTKDKHHQAD